ncbi:hypothetical protein [Shewanella frigidimarina]|uniref:Uncharacterized protein n=1 Tax=Shewanella frigidimarina TaxID=56812 RepID=A0A119CYH6_SHEFR|nr:hypothetical protein [Shewanella frigidimarina]KVW99814.1 hypothetical protein AWJ07_10930 [Shewanella frigidimarina]
MIKGIGESLNVMRQSQRLAPSSLTNIASQPQIIETQRTISKHRLDSYQRWAQTTAEQHSISASQVALQSLTQAKQLLQQLSRVLQVLQQETKGREDSRQAMLDNAETLRQQLIALDPRYQGIQLLDHHFNLLSSSSAVASHAFVFKSVDLIAPKERTEKIHLQLGRLSRVMQLPAGYNRESLLHLISPVFKDLGIALEWVGQELIYKASAQAWLGVQAGVLMMGEGQRLPAGELRQILIEPRYHWQDPREWNLVNSEQLKTSQAKIAKTQQKINQHSAEIEAVHQVLLGRIRSVQTKGTDVIGLEATSALKSLYKYMQPHPFSYQIASLMAQGNTNRDQVGALLG